MYFDDSHRSRIDIIESILRFIESKGRAKKTHILYATNLNTRSLEKYLKKLIDIHAVETIEDIDGRVKYSLTQYGKNLLRLINKLRKSLDQKDPVLEIKIVKVLSDRDDGIDTFTSIESSIVEGESGLTYTVIKTLLDNVEYVVIHIPEYNEISDIVSDIAYTILLLVDTKYNCIIYLKSISSKYRKGVIKDTMEKIFRNINVERNRYVFIE